MHSNAIDLVCFTESTLCSIESKALLKSSICVKQSLVWAYLLYVQVLLFCNDFCKNIIFIGFMPMSLKIPLFDPELHK